MRTYLSTTQNTHTSHTLRTLATMLPIPPPPPIIATGSRASRAASVPQQRAYSPLRTASPLRGNSPLRYASPLRGTSLAPLPLRSYGLRAVSLAPPSAGFSDPFFSEYDTRASDAPAKLSPTPVKTGRWGPRDSEVAFNGEGKFVFVKISAFRFCDSI